MKPMFERMGFMLFCNRLRGLPMAIDAQTQLVPRHALYAAQQRVRHLAHLVAAAQFFLQMSQQTRRHFRIGQCPVVAPRHRQPDELDERTELVARRLRQQSAGLKLTSHGPESLLNPFPVMMT